VRLFSKFSKASRPWQIMSAEKTKRPSSSGYGQNEDRGCLYPWVPPLPRGSLRLRARVRVREPILLCSPSGSSPDHKPEFGSLPHLGVTPSIRSPRFLMGFPDTHHTRRTLDLLTTKLSGGWRDLLFGPVYTLVETPRRESYLIE